MNIYFKDQSKGFPAHLRILEKAPVIAYDKTALKETITVVEIDEHPAWDKIDFNFLEAYHIFPTHIMSSLTQWEDEKREMAIGDTIVQQIYLPPFPGRSLKIVFGVRIVEIIDAPYRKGYTYQTLAGHVEKGISTFLLEKSNTGQMSFSIHTFSKPATLLATVSASFFSLPYQAYCSQQALLNVKNQLKAQVHQ